MTVLPSRRNLLGATLPAVTTIQKESLQNRPRRLVHVVIAVTAQEEEIAEVKEEVEVVADALLDLLLLDHHRHHQFLDLLLLQDLYQGLVLNQDRVLVQIILLLLHHHRHHHHHRLEEEGNQITENIVVEFGNKLKFINN